MDLTGMKYGFSTHFCSEHAFVGKLTPLGFEQNYMFFKTSKNCVHHCNVEPNKNMGHIRIKYGFLASFHCKHTFFGKTTLCILS
jgi:hypothetical protein